MYSTIDIMERGINCLAENLGIIEMEQFISTLKRENFDYTRWKQEHYTDCKAEQFHMEAVEYAKSHPFKGKATLLQLLVGIRLIIESPKSEYYCTPVIDKKVFEGITVWT